MRAWRAHSIVHAAVCAVTPACTPTALDTVDLGDHPEPADLPIDEAFFHCEIQPRVLTAQRCATGSAGDGGGCHLARSALRLVEVPAAPACRAGVLVDVPPPESQVNLARVAASIGLDAAGSPLYRRPLGLDSHPRAIFATSAPEAMLLRSWLDRGAAP
ncbi:MAG: hypothetical protein ABW252_12150 [Polyangiales bacterium]